MRIPRHDRLADALLEVARRLLRPDYRHWADAMRAEAGYVAREERVRWALGCLWTAIRMRFNPMKTGDYRVSRGTMLVEAIGAFVPLILAWFEIVFGPSGIVRLTREVIDRFFLTYPGGSYILVMMFVNGVIGLLGPVGLFLGLRYAFTGRGINSRSLGWTLAAVPVLANILGMMAGRVWGPLHFQDGQLTFAFLFAWLPAAVILHLTWISRPILPAAPDSATLARPT
jgi:hypothetical protein